MLEEVTLDNHWLMSQDPPDKGDEALLARFYLRAKKDNKASNEAGRPIFRNVEYVYIAKPGDKLDVHDQPATNRDRWRFRKQYEAFKRGQGNEVIGTPLSKWTSIDVGQVEELKYFNVVTVEQLALLPDGNIPNVGNISHLKKMAVDYLEAAKGEAVHTKLRAELEKRDSLLDAMQKQMTQQAELIAKLSAKADARDEADAKPKREKSTTKAE